MGVMGHIRMSRDVWSAERCGIVQRVLRPGGVGQFLRRGWRERPGRWGWPGQRGWQRWLEWWVLRSLGLRILSCVSGLRTMAAEVGLGSTTGEIGPRITANEAGLRIVPGEIRPRALDSIVAPKIRPREIRPGTRAGVVTRARILTAEIRPEALARVIGPRTSARVAGLGLAPRVAGPGTAQHALRWSLVGAGLEVGFSQRILGLRPARHTARPLQPLAGLRPINGTKGWRRRLPRSPTWLRTVSRTKGWRWRLQVVRGQGRLRREGRHQWQRIVGTQERTGTERVVGMRSGCEGR